MLKAQPFGSLRPHAFEVSYAQVNIVLRGEDLEPVVFKLIRKLVQGFLQHFFARNVASISENVSLLKQSRMLLDFDAFVQVDQLVVWWLAQRFLAHLLWRPRIGQSESNTKAGFGCCQNSVDI